MMNCVLPRVFVVVNFLFLFLLLLLMMMTFTVSNFPQFCETTSQRGNFDMTVAVD